MYKQISISALSLSLIFLSTAPTSIVHNNINHAYAIGENYNEEDIIKNYINSLGLIELFKKEPSKEHYEYMMKSLEKVPSDFTLSKYFSEFSNNSFLLDPDDPTKFLINKSKTYVQEVSQKKFIQLQEIYYLLEYKKSNDEFILRNNNTYVYYRNPFLNQEINLSKDILLKDDLIQKIKELENEIQALNFLDIFIDDLKKESKEKAFNKINSLREGPTKDYLLKKYNEFLPSFEFVQNSRDTYFIALNSRFETTKDPIFFVSDSKLKVSDLIYSKTAQLEMLSYKQLDLKTLDIFYIFDAMIHFGYYLEYPINFSEADLTALSLLEERYSKLISDFLELHKKERNLYLEKEKIFKEKLARLTVNDSNIVSEEAYKNFLTEYSSLKPFDAAYLYFLFTEFLMNKKELDSSYMVFKNIKSEILSLNSKNISKNKVYYIKQDINNLYDQALPEKAHAFLDQKLLSILRNETFKKYSSLYEYNDQLKKEFLEISSLISDKKLRNQIEKEFYDLKLKKHPSPIIREKISYNYINLKGEVSKNKFQEDSEGIKKFQDSSYVKSNLNNQLLNTPFNISFLDTYAYKDNIIYKDKFNFRNIEGKKYISYLKDQEVNNNHLQSPLNIIAKNNLSLSSIFYSESLNEKAKMIKKTEEMVSENKLYLILILILFLIYIYFISRNKIILKEINKRGDKYGQ